MSENILLRTMRSMAWKRARGELDSMLSTFWSSPTGISNFESLKMEIDAFIEKVECEELHI